MNEHTEFQQQQEPQMMAVSDVVFREDLYPRIEPDAQLVERYVESIESIRENAPIVVNQDRVLIDGNHRLLAHQTVGLTDIPYKVIETTSDDHLLELAIEANASHGQQLSAADKKRLAIRLFQRAINQKERTAARKRLKRLLRVSVGTLSNWLSNLDKTAQAEDDRKIWDLHLACYTHDAIAERMGVARQTITDKVQKLAENFNSEKIGKDFEPRLHDAWLWKWSGVGASRPGKSPIEIKENLVHAFTGLSDLVVDPYVGDGSMVKVCKRFGRRYFVSDPKPKPALGDMVRQHDVKEGLPPLPQNLWREVKMLFLDPPYWYEEGASGLTHRDADAFHAELETFITQCAAKMVGGSYIALLVEPTQWPLADRSIPIDHARELDRRLTAAGGPCEYVRTILCPHSSDELSEPQLAWARESGQHVVMSRTLTLWRVAEAEAETPDDDAGQAARAQEEAEAARAQEEAEAAREREEAEVEAAREREDGGDDDDDDDDDGYGGDDDDDDDDDGYGGGGGDDDGGGDDGYDDGYGGAGNSWLTGAAEEEEEVERGW